MASSSNPVVDRIRIIPRPNDFLDRNVGSSGEVFFNKATNSLRVYSGKSTDRGGFELAKADLSNIPSTGIDLPSVQKNKIRFHWDTLADLQTEVDPITYHGMVAHVHSEGRLYFAHAGAWIAVANQSEISSSIPTDISELTDTTNLLDHFSGSYTDLTNKPTIPTVLTDLSISDGTTGQILSTDGAGNFTFINAPGSTQNLFATIQSDDGSATASSPTETLSILGGTNISTLISTDTVDVEINMEPFEIGFLSNVSNAAATTGQVLKWDGSQWAPGTDITSGGSGLDADTLDGFEGTYYLDYNNFTNTPSVLTLTSLSVGNELAASGDGAISYDDTTGVFRYTPPDLSSYLTSVAFGDLTGTPTTLSGYGITDAQSTLVSGTNIKTINGSSLLGSGDITISGGASGGIELTDLSVGAEGTASGDGSISYDNTTGTFTYTPPVIPSILTDLGISDGSIGQVLTTNGSGSFSFTTVSSGTSNFSSLSEPSAASLTVDKIYEPAVIMFRVNNVSATAYTFDSHYSGNNPTIYVISGTTVAFDLDNISGHPFEIQDSTLSALTSNLVHVSNTGTVSLNSAAQGKSSGTLYWRIPENISGTYVYQCQSHAAMFGNITIKRLSLL